MVIRIESVDDPRVGEYVGMKDRDLARLGERFVAEGELVVRRLLASDFETESVFVIERKGEEMAALAGERVNVYVTTPAVMNQVVGFKFHSGVMAVGRKKKLPTLEELAQGWGERVTLLVCPRLVNTENLGAIARVAAAFGADGLVLGEQSCDPFYRQSVRVSMGTVFKLAVVQSVGLVGDLNTLKERWGFDVVGMVLGEGSEELARAKRKGRMALVLGNESEGLSAEEMAACTRLVTIPMSGGTDSLNVYVAAGIGLYHFTQAQVRP
jgi:tRNA G18 (ribose-2'-O)-methylase SpoU